jgi:HK97 family phage portal protein
VAHALAETEQAPHVRDASSQLLTAIQRSQAYSLDLSTALQVPAFVKALKTYTNTISAFPLKEYVGKDQVIARGLLNQPSSQTTYAAFMGRTVQDLLLYGEAYWRVQSRAWDGYPTEVEWMPYTQISFVPGPTNQDVMDPIPAFGQVYWNGVPVPPRDVIRFDGDGTGGWLTTMASACNTAAALEAASLRYAEYPVPNVVLKNSGADLPGAVVDDLLDAWESARTNRSTAYLNSTISTETVGGWNPNDLQLVQARDASALAIARQANLDAAWVNATQSGSSLTYSNRTDLYRQLLDLSLTPVMLQISQRLSMNDVTPRGHEVEFDTSVFLRANPAEIATLISTLQPLGIIDTTEARDLLDLPDIVTADPQARP